MEQNAKKGDGWFTKPRAFAMDTVAQEEVLTGLLKSAGDFSPAKDGLGRSRGACTRITEALLTHWGKVGHQSLLKQGAKNAGMDLAKVTDVLFGTEANTNRNKKTSEDLQSVSEAVIICKLRAEQRKHQAATDENIRRQNIRKSQQPAALAKATKAEVPVASRAPQVGVQQQTEIAVIGNFQAHVVGASSAGGGSCCCGGGGKDLTERVDKFKLATQKGKYFFGKEAKWVENSTAVSDLTFFESVEGALLVKNTNGKTIWTLIPSPADANSNAPTSTNKWISLLNEKKA